MVKSSDKESSVAPFLMKCYEMVDDSSTDAVISWSGTDSISSFVIWDTTDFSVRLLPIYFKHSNFSSFIRQLNVYLRRWAFCSGELVVLFILEVLKGFRKIDTDRWEFTNDGFIRDQKELLKTIVRRKNAQSVDNRKPVEECDNINEPSERVGDGNLWKEFENLKTDKNALMLELKKLRQHQEISDNNLLLLTKRVQGMEKNQQQMLSFLVMVMQNPSFIVQLLQPKESNWRMAEPGSITEQWIDNRELFATDGTIVRYQHATTLENPPDATPAVDEMKDVFLSADFVKVLMDDHFPSLDNQAPFVLPELSDDRAWEQLLLRSPFLENVEDPKQPVKESNHAQDELEGMNDLRDFDFLTEELEKSRDSEGSTTDPEAWLKSSQSMEILTKQLGLLASETNHMDGTP